MRSYAEPSSAESLKSQFYALPVVEGWSHVKVERRCTVWTKTFASVEIDDVTNALTAPVHYPVVSVKWGCVSGNASKVSREVTRIEGRCLTLTAI